MEQIQVRAADGNRVGLWERHPAHPNEEIFVAGDAVVEVARTRRIEQALREGVLVEAPVENESQLEKRTRQLLADAGFADDDAVRSASDEDLLAVDGVGSMTLASIREALG